MAVLQHNPVSTLIRLLDIFCSAGTLPLTKADYLHGSDKSVEGVDTKDGDVREEDSPTSGL